MRFLSFFLMSLLFFNADATSMLDSSLFEQLKKAVLENDIVTAHNLITKIPADKINKVDSKKDTLLHLAVYQKNLEMSQLLLKNGANPNIYNPYGNSSFFLVVSNWEKGPNKSALIKDLVIKYGANTEVFLDHVPLGHLSLKLGYFPLQRLSLEDIKFLLDHDPRLANAKIAPGVDRETVLFYAVREGKEKEDPSLAKLFLEKGADPNRVNSSGGTLLSLVLRHWEEGPIKSALIKDLVLEYGADTQFLLTNFPLEKLNLGDIRFLVKQSEHLVKGNFSLVEFLLKKEGKEDPSFKLPLKGKADAQGGADLDVKNCNQIL